LFEECPRRFYYQNYFAKMGQYPDAPDDAALAAEMARVKGLDMWVGEVVHGTIQWVLECVKDGRHPTDSEAKVEARRRLSEGWQSSVRQLWRTHRDDDHPSLFEHYYKIPVTPGMTDRIKNKAFACIDNFMGSDLLKSIVSITSDKWLPIEKFASFRLDGLLFYIKFDFALRDGSDIIVYDWKTGNPTEQENKQLACYALYASERFDVPIENVRVSAVHLQPVLDANERYVQEDDIESARSFAKQSFSAMLNCLRDPARNRAAMDDFPMTGNFLRCSRCSFRGICIQGKQASGDIDDLPVVDDWDA
jgi:hypothetical protein